MKRHRVRLRPKARRRRRLGGFFLVLLGAGVSLRMWAPRVSLPGLHFPSWSVPALPRAAEVDELSVSGVPEDLKPLLLASIRWKAGDRWGPSRPYRAARELEENFSCLSSVRARRSWLHRSVRFEASLRLPLAKVTDAKAGPAFMDSSGVVFVAPAGGYGAQPPLPEVALNRRPADQPLAALADMLVKAGKPGGLLARIVRLGYQPSEGGWRVELEDGTHLLWGNLSWTEQKLARLREVLADAGKRFGGGITADMRHFEDGKIFVRPR